MSEVDKTPYAVELGGINKQIVPNTILCSTSDVKCHSSASLTLHNLQCSDKATIHAWASSTLKIGYLKCASATIKCESSATIIIDTIECEGKIDFQLNHSGKLEMWGGNIDHATGIVEKSSFVGCKAAIGRNDVAVRSSSTWD